MGWGIVAMGDIAVPDVSRWNADVLCGGSGA
jgi:hypothetical protein